MPNYMVIPPDKHIHIFVGTKSCNRPSKALNLYLRRHKETTHNRFSVRCDGKALPIYHNLVRQLGKATLFQAEIVAIHEYSVFPEGKIIGDYYLVVSYKDVESNNSLSDTIEALRKYREMSSKLRELGFKKKGYELDSPYKRKLRVAE